MHAQGEILLLKDTINKMVERLQNFATEVTKVAKEVGTDGILGGQARVRYSIRVAPSDRTLTIAL